ncbi:MAG: galactose oxidase-like domain-containing protein [Candidatus Acidiferrales bacterium]
MTKPFEQHRILLSMLFLVLIALASAPSSFAQANVQGQWQTLSTEAPINPIHVALMHNGNVLIVSGSGDLASDTTYMAGVWDPATDTITTQPVSWDMFCNGMIILPDGRPFIMGGTLQYNPSFFGLALTSAYDPGTGNFYNLQSMAHGRWYPSSTVLGNGQVMTFSGLTETGATDTAVEIYTVGSGWSTQYTAPWTPPLYPRTTVLSNGNVFFSGSTPEAWTFNPATHVWTSGPYTNYGGTRTYGTSVLLPLSPSNNYAPTIMIMGGASPATATTELISPLASSPSWVYGPSMSEPRIEMNATILPSGEILATGGSQIDENGSTASLNADLYNPSTNTFTSAGANAYARLYHSNSILLPNATVLLLGSNPSQGVYEGHMEIYSPAYLFTSSGSLATRPTITSVTPGVIGYGATFQVETPEASSISSAVLIRPGAVTHSFDMDQRLINLSYTVGSGVLTATAPPNGNVAPPGYYMLFILNSSGVPSLATFVQLSAKPTDTPPTGSITSPSSNPTIGTGQKVNFAGSGTAPDGSIAGYSWVFPGGSPASSTLADPGNVTYSTAGTYVASLTVTDNDGLTDPSPETRTITVGPDFTVSSTPASQTVAAGNATTYTVTVSAGTGFTGSVSFGVSGLPANATATFNPTSVTTSGSSTLSISTTTSVASGTYSLVIAGTSGGLTNISAATLIVNGSTDTQPPTAPTNLTATAASSTQINLTWTASTDNVGVTGYEVQRCEGAGCTNFAQIATPTGTTYTDTGLLASTSYSYRVLATDAAGNLSAFSNTASATTLSASSAPAIKFVQVNSATPSTPSSSVAVVFKAAQAAGDLNVVAVGWNDTVAKVSSVTDSKGNAYTLAIGPTAGSNLSQSIYYAKNISSAAAGANTVTVTFNTAAAYPDIRIVEYSGVSTTSPLDVELGAAGSSTASSSGAITTTNANDLLFGANMVFTETTGPGSGFTSRVISPDGDIAEDEIVTATGSYSATASLSPSAAWVMQLVAFKAAAAGTTPAITFIQVNSATPSAASTSVPVVYKSAQTAGDLNIVVAGWNDSTATIKTVTDSSGNAYTLAVGPTVQTGYATQAIYYAKNILGAAAKANTVTVTFNVGAIFADIRILEYSGLNTTSPLDVTSAAIASTGTSNNSGSATTTNANDLIFGANLVQTTTQAAGSGFTSRIITPYGDIAEDEVVSAVGSYSATATLTSSGPWIMQMVAFKAQP